MNQGGLQPHAFGDRSGFTPACFKLVDVGSFVEPHSCAESEKRVEPSLPTAGSRFPTASTF